MEEKSIKIIHIISSLEKGGAQGLLLEIIQNLDKPNYQHLIISLKAGNAYEAITQAQNINILSMNLTTLNLLKSLKDILRVINQFKPNIIQSWMYHADFLTIILKPFLNNLKIIWSFHHAHPGKNKKRSIFLAKLCSKFSNIIPFCIIACSNITKKEHIEFGYSEKKILVINNGVDEKRFKYNPRIHLPKEQPVIGFIGRWHQIKGHETFIKAAKILNENIDAPKFIMIGSNLDNSNHDLLKIIESHGLCENIELFGEEEVDIRKYYEMMDIYICSSWSESFSLTIVESALQGIPIVSTDVGIIRDITDNDRLINKVGDSEGIAKSVMKLIDYEADVIEAQLRNSFENAYGMFSLNRMLNEYEAIYNQCLIEKK